MQQIQTSNILELTEVKLMRLKELKDAIKVLDAEKTMIESELKNGYFAENEIYQTSRGLILATYKEQIRSQFDVTKFKINEPQLYDKYLDLKAIRVFLLK